MSDYHETTARSILRKQKTTDSWFVSRVGMNLYRGCEHACAYCDGRAERYRVEGRFGQDVQVKTNAPELLRRELGRLRGRGMVFVGGGVSDAYQQAEQRYELTRRCLEVIEELGRPVHVLTKSALVERDLDLLEAIHQRAGAMVSFSFSSADPTTVELLEPGCAPVSERLRVLELCRRRGLPTGAMLMPIVPQLSDSEEQLEPLVRQVAEAGVSFALFGGMTLKPGRQQQHFLQLLARHHPRQAERIRALYPGHRWGHARGDYYTRLNALCRRLLVRYKVAPRVPLRLFQGKVERNVEVALVLSHIHYLLQLRGEQRTAYERVAHSLQRLDHELEDVVERGMLRHVPGVGQVTGRLIEQMVRSGQCGYYNSLMKEYTGVGSE